MNPNHNESMELIEQGSSSRRIINIDELAEMFKVGNYRRGFSMVDENKDGRIDIRELKTMIQRIENKIPHNVVQKILKMADTDNDGYLDYHEFVKMVNNPDLKVFFGNMVQSYVTNMIPKRNGMRKRNAEDSDDTDGRYEQEYSCCPPPITMLLISVIIIVLYTIDDYYFNSKTGTGPMATALMYNPHRRYEAWRYISYMFVHIGYMHLCVNLIVQIILGIPLEMVHGGWRVMVIYLSGVVAGSLGTSLTDPWVFLAGASGGVYALTTAHISCVVMNWSEMAIPYVQLTMFVLLICSDFGTAIYNRYYLETKDNIGFEAHVAGALAGLFVGIFMLRNLERNKCENYVWWIALVAYCCFTGVAIIWNIAYPSYFPEQF